MEFQSQLSQERVERNSVPLPIHAIFSEVCAKHGFTAELMRGERRNSTLFLARGEFYFRAAAETAASFPIIGRVINRDHTTVIYGAARYAINQNLPAPRGVKIAKRAADRFERRRLRRFNLEKRDLPGVSRPLALGRPANDNDLGTLVDSSHCLLTGASREVFLPLA
jgi:hypothetical protein